MNKETLSCPKTSHEAGTDQASPYLLSFHQPLPGLLVKRYKRFLADIQLSDGTIITAHCTNTGSMASVNIPGQPVILSTATNPDRKLKFTWEAIGIASDGAPQLAWVGVNTANPNKLIAEALKRNLIKEIGLPQLLRQEVVVTPGTRLDFELTMHEENKRIYIEVKNVSLREERAGKAIAFFPDSISERGTKHLNELASLARQGHRAIIFFVVQRTDCLHVEPAAHIDPVYSQTLKKVMTQDGVEALAYSFEATMQGIRLSHKLAVKI